MRGRGNMGKEKRKMRDIVIEKVSKKEGKAIAGYGRRLMKFAEGMAEAACDMGKIVREAEKEKHGEEYRQRIKEISNCRNVILMNAARMKVACGTLIECGAKRKAEK